MTIGRLASTLRQKKSQVEISCALPCSLVMSLNWTNQRANKQSQNMSAVTEEPPTQSTSPCMEMPGPVKEHELLQKFVGEWESEGEALMAPGQPPAKIQGIESSRLIGGFWFVAQIKSTIPDFPYEQILTSATTQGRENTSER